MRDLTPLGGCIHINRHLGIGGTCHSLGYLARYRSGQTDHLAASFLAASYLAASYLGHLLHRYPTTGQSIAWAACDRWSDHWPGRHPWRTTELEPCAEDLTGPGTIAAFLSLLMSSVMVIGSPVRQ
jgi:hypothetical protein